MHTFQSVLRLHATLLAIVILALFCTACTSTPAPQEQLRTAVIQPCNIGGITPFAAPYDRCDDIKAKLAEKSPSAPAPAGNSGKLVDCVLPGGETQKLSFGGCREQAGVIFEPEEHVAESHPSVGTVSCIVGTKKVQMPLHECLSRGGYDEHATIRAVVAPQSAAQANRVVRRNDCDASGWFCGAPPPRMIGGGSGCVSTPGTSCSSWEINIGNNSRGSYGNVRTQTYQSW